MRQGAGGKGSGTLYRPADLLQRLVRDKFQQLFSSVNPVASSAFQFSVPETNRRCGSHRPADSLAGTGFTDRSHHRRWKYLHCAGRSQQALCAVTLPKY